MKKPQTPSSKYRGMERFTIREVRTYHMKEVSAWQQSSAVTVQALSAQRSIFFHTSPDQSAKLHRSNQQKSIMAPVNDALLTLIDSWLQEGDEYEQQETWTALRADLDEDRPSDRKLFP